MEPLPGRLRRITLRKFAEYHLVESFGTLSATAGHSVFLGGAKNPGELRQWSLS
jgi:hypothetical protein